MHRIIDMIYRIILVIIYAVLAIEIFYIIFFSGWESICSNYRILYTDYKIYTKDYQSSGMINKKGNIEDYLIKKTDRYYLLIPENVRDSYQENGWNIYVTDENIGSNPDSAAIGLFVPREKTIYISNRFDASSAIIHEMGHYIDYAIKTSEVDEFVKIYDSELAKFKKIYPTNIKNISTPKEYFATAYEAIILFPEKVKSNCPLTYEYISKCSKEI